MAEEQVSTGTDEPINQRRGFFFALSAYVMWGLLPFYMKAIDEIPAMEIIAHRVFWSVPAAGLLLWWMGRTSDLVQALKTPKILLAAALPAIFIAVNWGVYVWSILVERALEAALGYYINPLFSIVLGVVFLGDRFTRAQAIAIALATIGVIILTIATGGLPWISLVLAFSFGMYGYLRKTLPIGPTQGFLLEVLMLLPLAIVIIGYYALVGNGHFGNFDAYGFSDTAMLLLAGPLTAIPLIAYTSGAKQLRLSTLGLMQYIVPTMVFVIAVFVFEEPFSVAQLVAFCFIWAALIIYSVSMMRTRRPNSQSPRHSTP